LVQPGGHDMSPEMIQIQRRGAVYTFSRGARCEAARETIGGTQAAGWDTRGMEDSSQGQRQELERSRGGE